MKLISALIVAALTLASLSAFADEGAAPAADQNNAAATAPTKAANTGGPTKDADPLRAARRAKAAAKKKPKKEANGHPELH